MAVKIDKISGNVFLFTDTPPTGGTLDPSQVYSKFDVNVLLAGKSNTGHTHTFSELTAKPVNLSGYGITDGVDNTTFVSYTGQTDILLSGKSGTGHTHTFAELTAKPATLSGYGITDGLDNTTFATYTGQTQAALSGKSDAGHTHTFSEITAKPVTLSGYGITDAYASAQTDALLTGKSDTGHTHTFNELTGKPTTISGYGITDAVDNSRFLSYTGQTQTTLAEIMAEADATSADLDVAEADIDLILADLDVIEVQLAGKSNSGHTHTFNELTGKPTTLSGYGITDAYTGGTVDLSGYYTSGQTNSLLAGKSDTGHTHTFGELTARPTTISGYGITDAFTGYTASSGITITGGSVSVRTAGVPDVSGLEANASGLTLNISGYTTPNPVSIATSRTLLLSNSQSSVLFDQNRPPISDQTFAFGTGFNNPVNTLGVQADGRILAGGDFTAYNGVTTGRIIRLNADGTADTSFNTGTGFNGNVTSIVVQPNGRILVGGVFTAYNGLAANRIIRLNADGTADTSFNYGSGFDTYVQIILLRPDGKMMVGGDYTTYNGTFTSRITRLNADGTIDTAFNPGGFGFNGPVQTISAQADGKFIVSGFYTSYNAVATNFLLRINANGSQDNTFVVGTGFEFNAFASLVQPDGKILLGGGFTVYNGVTANRIIRLNADGTVDTAFNYGSGFSLRVLTLNLLPDGKILVGGRFTTYNGGTAGRIIRLNADGTVDTSFNSGTGFDGDVLSVALIPGGRYVAGGNFTSYNGTAAGRVIRLLAGFSLTVASPTGIEYAADYSPGYSPRSLTDKAYVDARVSGRTYTFSELTAKPTTVAGYGITDAEATVRGAVLTGVNVTLPGTVAATDSVLQAAGKLQRQADALQAGKSDTSHTHTFASLTAKPTTVAGYGITDAYTKAETLSLVNSGTTSGYQYFNELPGTLSDAVISFAQNGTGAGWVTRPSTSTTIGVVRLNLGTTATGRASLNMQNMVNFHLGVGEAYFECRFQHLTASNATTTFTTRLGLLNSNSSESSSGVFFRYTDTVNGGNWQCVTRSNNVETVVNTTVSGVNALYQNFQIVVNGSGTLAVFSISGVSVGSISSNIPNIAGREVSPALYCQRSVGTVAASPLDADYIGFRYILNTPRIP